MEKYDSRRVLIFSIFFVYFSGTTLGSLVSISYDDGVPEDGFWLDGSLGHAVAFAPPADSWTLSKVAVCGMLNPKSEGETFVLEIWNEDLNLLYGRADVSRSYFGEEMKWAEIDVPDLQVSGVFFVCLFEFSSIYVGADLGEAASLSSQIVSRSPNKVDVWNLQSPQNETDWMIAAVGYSPAPRAELRSSPTEGGLLAEVAMADEDGNLAQATIYIVVGDEVVWSEKRQVEGSKANITLEWPRRTFAVTNGTVVLSPVFMTKTTDGVSEEKATYMIYSAPCVLNISADGTSSAAIAHFGQDGEFHALVDIFGFAHYISSELFDLAEPSGSYGRYTRENMSLQEGELSLIFFSLNLDEGGETMVAHQPLVLERSPIHHYGLSLREVEARPGEHKIYVDVEDQAGNIFRAFENTTFVLRNE